MAPSADYVKAYETAKKELSDLIIRHHEIEKRIILVRQSLQTFATLCESDGIHIDTSGEAHFLIEYSSLADEIRALLKCVRPGYLRPHEIKLQLERLGYDMGKYQNPQATIQMVLARMMDSGEVQEVLSKKERKAYRIIEPEVSTKE